MADRPRLLLVDDHALFLAGVRAELGDGVEVVGEADDVAPAIELIGERLPDVVLLDVHLPGGSGAEVVAAIHGDHPEVLRLIARGYSYMELARELSISVKTVASHVSAVLRKLQLSSRHQLTRWAAERRLV